MCWPLFACVFGCIVSFAVVSYPELSFSYLWCFVPLNTCFGSICFDLQSVDMVSFCLVFDAFNADVDCELF